MDLELVKFINSDLTWSAVKKGPRSIMRRHRRTKASGSHSGNKTRDSDVSDHEKSGVAILGQHFAEEVRVPLKKRILLLQSCAQRARSPQPKTPSPHHEPPMGRDHASEAIEPTEKAISDLNDFSGIELLATAACHSSGHVESFAVEEHSTPIVESLYPDGIKHDISPMDSVDSSVQDNAFTATQSHCDSGNDESDKIYVPTKVARLHWDLNTVMEEWEEPCDIQVAGDEELSVEPEIGYLGKAYNAESCPSKSDVVDSLEETTMKVESDDKQAVSEVVQGGCLSLKGDTDDKLTLEDHLSDCCGSNVSQDKVIKSGYESPAEDGELREEPAWEKEESEEMECVDYESDDMYEDNSDAIESVTNEIVADHPQPMKASVSVPDIDIEQVSDKPSDSVSKHSQSVVLEEKKNLLPERKNMACIDRPTTTTSSSCIRRSRSERDFGQEEVMRREGPSYHTGQRVDSFSRNSHGSSRYPRPKHVRPCGSSSIDNNEAMNYNPRGVNVYRNESYGFHNGTSSSRDISRGRSRVGLRRDPQEEYNNNPDPFYSERKVPSFNRGANLSRSQKQSRSRSRSGSPPIAWHFQKRNVDTKRQSPDYKKCVSGSFDARDIINEQYRERRSSPVGTFHRAHQRHDPSGYVGKLKSNDHIRPRFPPNYSSIHDKYGMMNERKRFRYDDDESFKGYSRNKDNGFRYTRMENKCFRESKNTSEEKGCRYTANKMFSTGEGHFYKDN